MRINRQTPDSSSGSPDWFTGTAWMERIDVPEMSKLRIHLVHFAPSVRSAWHRHPHGQLLYITEGAGLVQCRGGQVQPVRAGDTIWIEPDEWHWHGASAHTYMSHLAVHEAADDGVGAERGELVSEVEYTADI
jgi:quercetin dioxygenase-like cupin family protein